MKNPLPWILYRPRNAGGSVSFATARTVDLRTCFRIRGVERGRIRDPLGRLGHSAPAASFAAPHASLLHMKKSRPSARAARRSDAPTDPPRRWSASPRDGFPPFLSSGWRQGPKCCATCGTPLGSSAPRIRHPGFLISPPSDRRTLLLPTCIRYPKLEDQAPSPVRLNSTALLAPALGVAMSGLEFTELLPASTATALFRCRPGASGRPPRLCADRSGTQIFTMTKFVPSLHRLSPGTNACSRLVRAISSTECMTAPVYDALQVFVRHVRA